MQGAREYYGLLKTGQYGNLYISVGEHARGKTLHVQILPDGEKAKENYGNMCINPDAVEVYGIVSGQPGWTETYGWKHKGPWQADFEKLVVSMRLAKEAQEESNRCETEESAKKAADDLNRKLSAYVSKEPSDEDFNA